MTANTPKILIIDEDKRLIEAYADVFRKVCKVFTATRAVEVVALLLDQKVDIVLCDVHFNSSGIILAYQMRAWYPKMTVCLMTDRIRSFYQYLDGSIQCIEKVHECKTMVASVVNLWLLEHPRWEARWKRERILRQLPFKGAIELVSRRPENGAEVMDARLCRDDKPRFIRSVVYRYAHPSHLEMIDIGIMVGRGCRGGCRTCLTGRIKNYVTSLTPEEMVAQVLHGLDSFRAYGHLAEKYEISVNFTCGDDFIFNAENVCQAIEMMAEVPELNASFVITTIGNVEVLRKYLPRLARHRVKIYWSAHSLCPMKRGWLLPRTKGQSLEDTRGLLSGFAAAVGQGWEPGKRWTLSWMLIKGFNDSKKDINDLVDFCQGWPVEVKVMLATEGCLPGFSGKAGKEDAEAFVAELEGHGIAARFRENMGSDAVEPSYWSCGTTLPYTDYHIVEAEK